MIMAGSNKSAYCLKPSLSFLMFFEQGTLKVQECLQLNEVFVLGLLVVRLFSLILYITFSIKKLCV